MPDSLREAYHVSLSYPQLFSSPPPPSLTVPADAKKVRVTYASSPGAGGLQWLVPSQTAGKKRPFLFTQGEAILTRTWIPLQDSPQVRVTYTARVRTPKDLVAVMSA